MSRSELWFVFDPLCGWCYAAHPTLAALEAEGLGLRFLPSGLFAGANARPMTASFRDHAWGHDQQIRRLTGQVFSEQYYHQVLSDFSRPLDSAAATLAFQVLHRAAPTRGVELLHRIQALRYVDGSDITRLDTLAALAPAFGLGQADFLAACAPGGAEAAELEVLTVAVRQLMERLHLQGVPNLIQHSPLGNRVVPSGLLYRGGAELAGWLRAQAA